MITNLNIPHVDTFEKKRPIATSSSVSEIKELEAKTCHWTELMYVI